MNASAQLTSELPGQTEEEKRGSLARQIAADQIARGVHLQFSELYLQLMYVVDAGLLESKPSLHSRAEKLARDGEQLEARIFATYKRCRLGAHHLLTMPGVSLAQEVDLYRQEQFWCREDRESLIVSEEIVRDLYRYYRDAVLLVRQIDAMSSARMPERVFPELQRLENPYESIIPE